MNISLSELVNEALAYEAAAFDQDEPVDGGDIVEWFADWRQRAKAALSPMPVVSHTPAESRRVQTQLIGVLQALQALQRRRYTLFGDTENDRLIEALHNGGFQIVAGELNVVVSKRHRRALPCKDAKAGVVR